MKKHFKILIVFLALIPTLLGIKFLFYFSNDFGFVFPWEEEKIIQTTLDWGGLDKLPDDAKNFKFEKHGSVFSTQYMINFESSKPKIDDWINRSKRLKNYTPKQNKDVKLFEIIPGEKDALGGKVEIKNNHVKINMSWS